MESKAILIGIIIGVIVGAAYTTSISSTKADSVNILSHSSYVGILGWYWVVGEVQNVGSQPLDYVRVTATYYRSNGIMVGTASAYIELDILNPGRKSPFLIIYTDTARIPDIDHYSLAISSFSPASALPGKLKILSSEGYIDQSGYVHVIGEIQNLGSTTATFVKLIATFYDQTGKVVAEGDVYSDPYDVQSGQKAPFDLRLSEKIRVPLISTYALTAQSTQYSLQLADSPIPPNIAYFNVLFGINIVRVIYPSDNPSKPLGCLPAWVSDWLASMSVSTKLTTYMEGLDTNGGFVDQTSGKPVGDAGEGVVSFGGPVVNPVVRYAESGGTPAEDRAPIRFHDEGGMFYFQRGNGEGIPGASLPISVINGGQDMFVIEVFRDGDGRYVMLCYGFGWKGTYAAGKYFHTEIYPNLYAYDVGWIIVKWEDTDNNGFVNNPTDGDTYTIIALG